MADTDKLIKTVTDYVKCCIDQNIDLNNTLDKQDSPLDVIKKATNGLKMIISGVMFCRMDDL